MPVKAPADGVVTLAHPDMYFSGATLIIDHGHGLSSPFLHLDSIEVAVGQRVRQDEVVARLGKSGRVPGPHLARRMTWRDQRPAPPLPVPPMSEAGERARPALRDAWLRKAPRGAAFP